MPTPDETGEIVHQYVESQDEPDTGQAFQDRPKPQSRTWGRQVRKRPPMSRERNLSNRYRPLDVLFAQAGITQKRSHLLPPGLGRDLLVWTIGLLAIGQMLARMMAILPLVLGIGETHLDIQMLAAISLTLGGALTGVFAIIIIRCLTGMRYTSYWIWGVLILFGLFPWYSFGAPLSPAGIPPIPSIISLFSNPIFDPSGAFGLILIISAGGAALATVGLFVSSGLKKS